ncbi:MAG TPA: nitroreductase family protein, partial [Chthonomonadales bacterium]|nr:nitroreductase family protein [Chthonomonadales bacterium]
MSRCVRWIPAVVLGVRTLLGCGQARRNTGENVAVTQNVGGSMPSTIPLPAPRLGGPMSVEEALAGRRSERNYRDEPLTLAEVAQLLWSAQGITASAWGGRTAPSAGATYPLEVFAVVGAVEGIAAGLHQYLPTGHSLRHWKSGDLRPELSREAL